MTEENNKIFAIGDIHGSYDKLCTLLERLPYISGIDRLVFLGDYINRGKDSSKVIDLLCKIKKDDPNTITLIGNHEHLLLECQRIGDQVLLPYLKAMGFDKTLESYRGGTLNLKTLDFMPREHLDFLKNLLPYWQNEQYIFVHAGLTPGVEIEKTDISTLCEARDSFFKVDYNFGKKVIFGHTPFELPLVTPYKIGIDTGAVYGNLLTAIELPGEIFYHA